MAIAFALRVPMLDKYPPSLNWDEISHGYNAYSIYKTGQDEWGKPLPITNFRAYGDYPLPLNLYTTIPFITILGLNETSIRLPHALLGVLTVVAAFFLVWGVTKKKELGLLTAFLVAIDPWYIFTSRFVIQSNLSVFLLTVGMAAFFWRDKFEKLLPIAFLCLGLSLFSYHSTRIFTPLLLIAILFLYRNEWWTKFREKSANVFISLLLIVVFFAPLPFILANPEARARSNEVFILNQSGINTIISQRQSSNLSPTLARVLYNRPIYFIKEFSKNYVEYFSPQFLFLDGGTQYQFSIPHFGLLFPVNLIFFYVGFGLLLFHASRGKKEYKLLLLWIILAPIPAALTTEHFAVLRSTTILPLPEFISVLGVFASYNWTKKRLDNGAIKIGIIVYFLALLLLLGDYLQVYVTSYPRSYSWAWQYGYKEAVQSAANIYSQYDAIIVTKKYGEPHEYFLFYGAEFNAPWNWQPDKYRSDSSLVRFYQSNWYWVDRFDKFYFVNDWEIPKSGNNFVLESGGKIGCDVNSLRCLLITSPNNAPSGWHKTNMVNFLDDSPAFEFYENF